ncbi:MAG TPA: DUF4397 domain-containing protein [Ktedonobacteraceae bacterium]|nr:DUF4397 domain-containing protein [Ktedonobacteraceae bacterium]
MTSQRKGAKIASWAGLALGVLALFVAFTFQSSTAKAAVGNALVRIIHAAPDAGPVDIYADGRKMISNFQFGTITGYASVPAGTHTIKIVPAGKNIAAAVTTKTVTINTGVPYTEAVVGTPATGFNLDTFVDNNIVSAGMTKVRVYHLSPDAGPVDVAANGSKMIRGLMYQANSNYLSVAPGAYTFEVTATKEGTTVPLSTSLRAGTINSVFAIGLMNGSPKLKFVTATVAGAVGAPTAATTAPGSSTTGSNVNARP